MALRAITAKGVAVGAIVAVVTSASLLLRLPRRSINPPPALAARALPVALVSLSELPLREWTALESREDVFTPPAQPRPIPSRTLAVHTSRVQHGRRSAVPATPSFDDTETPVLASRPIAFVGVDVAVDERKTGETSRSGAITKAMGTTGRAFRVAGTSVASAFRKVF
jgi:hypothetical protein